MPTTTDAEIIATRNAYNALFSQTEVALNDLRGEASRYLQPGLSQAGFDNNPTWNIARGRDAAATPNANIRYTPPEFNFDGDLEDAFAKMELERYSYGSAFFDDFLDERLRNWIDGQGYFLATEVQAALFEAARQRDLLTLSDALLATNRLEAQRGFPVPNDMLVAARENVISKHTALQADRNKEITALIADKSLQEKLEAVRSGVQMEDIRSRFKLEYRNMYLKATEWITRKYETMLRSAMASLDADIKRVELGLRPSEFNATLDLKYATLEQDKQIQRLNGALKELEALVSTWSQSAKMGMEAAAGAVNFYSNAALGTSAQINIVKTDS